MEKKGLLVVLGLLILILSSSVDADTNESSLQYTIANNPFHENITVDLQANLSPTPIITSISPATEENTGLIRFDIRGMNFINSSSGKEISVTLTKLDQQIMATSVNYISPTQISCNLPITGAEPGKWDVTVANGDSQFGTLKAGFEITPPGCSIRSSSIPVTENQIPFAACPPLITNITPNFSDNRNPVQIRIDGIHFQDNLNVSLLKEGQPNINATSVNRISSSQIICTLPIRNVTPGVYSVFVTNPDEQTGSLKDCLTIILPLSIFNITPNSGENYGPVFITNISGTGFISGAKINLTARGQPDICANEVTVVSPSQITCNLPITNVSAGFWNVTITNPDGNNASLTNGFQIYNPFRISEVGCSLVIDSGRNWSINLMGKWLTIKSGNLKNQTFQITWNNRTAYNIAPIQDAISYYDGTLFVGGCCCGQVPYPQVTNTTINTSLNWCSNQQFSGYQKTYYNLPKFQSIRVPYKAWILPGRSFLFKVFTSPQQYITEYYFSVVAHSVGGETYYTNPSWPDYDIATFSHWSFVHGSNAMFLLEIFQNGFTTGPILSGFKNNVSFGPISLVTPNCSTTGLLLGNSYQIIDPITKDTIIDAPSPTLPLKGKVYSIPAEHFSILGQQADIIALNSRESNTSIMFNPFIYPEGLNYSFFMNQYIEENSTNLNHWINYSSNPVIEP